MAAADTPLWRAEHFVEPTAVEYQGGEDGSPHLRTLLNNCINNPDRSQVEIIKTAHVDDLFIPPGQVDVDSIRAAGSIIVGSILWLEGNNIITGVPRVYDADDQQVRHMVFASLVKDSDNDVGLDANGFPVIQFFTSNIDSAGNYLDPDGYKVSGSDPALYVSQVNILNLSLVSHDGGGDACTLFKFANKKFAARKYAI